MNELLFVAITLVSLSLVLVALRLGMQWIFGLVATYLLLANLFASKLSIIFGLTSSLAIPVYAAIFLATDSVAEHYGKQAAYRVVWMGFLAQLCLVVFGQLMARGVPIGDPTVSDSLSTIFGFIPRIVLGSFVAYIISQSFDVRFYHFLKEAFAGRLLGLRNCLSTVLSQGIDSAIFLLIAFHGKLPNLGEFFLSVWLIKVAVALFDTPFIYLSYRVLGKRLKDTQGDATAETP
jgi:uncharacterized integral membrane protein (TIGR00697 family)